MIKTESIEINGMNLKQTYSDKGLIIRKIGTNDEYSEAIDILDSNFQYEETDKPIETQPTEAL